MYFIIDKENKKIMITREFAAPVPEVWDAWTKKELLEKWRAPKPWKARTKTMDFSEGGHWLYSMDGPNGEKIWSREDFLYISPLKYICIIDSFSDEQGNISIMLPASAWSCGFKEAGDSTIVDIEIAFKNVPDLEKIIGMGFREGFTACLENLDELLSRVHEGARVNV